ncbi:MAG: hypothetical protein ICV87_05590 [Gemmatimonadetes bacterium]|nr:hypothetical protein [Gemmatimonadota bacterium]
MLRSKSRRLAAAWLLSGTAVLGGCDADLSTTVPDSGYIDRAAVVVNRGDRTLTTIPFAASEAPRTLVLGTAGVPSDLAVRNERALVPMEGTVLVVDLRMGTIERRLMLLPTQTGQRVAFVNDTLALVSSPAGGTITAVNPQTGRVAPPSGAAGVGPLDVLPSGPKIYVLSSPPAPAVPAVVVLDTLLRFTGVIPLSGTSPRAMVMRGSFLYVLHAGAPGSAGGALSIVDTGVGRETGFVQGFGESPESMAFNSRGELFVSVPGRGLIVFNPVTRAFTPGPETPLASRGLDRVTRVAADPAGFVYALQPDGCDRPGTLLRLNADGSPAASVTTGICPTDVEFTALPLR